MTETERLLVKAIRANPADDLPRLMYADEIQDAQPEYAEFIRVQVELARLKDAADPKKGISIGKDGEWKYETPEVLPRYQALCDRERELFRSDAIGRCLPHDFDANITLINPISIGSRTPSAWLVRGFICEIASPADKWQSHADAITERHPLERVTLTSPPDPSWLRKRLRKMKGGAEKLEEIDDRYVKTPGYRAHRDFLVYLRHLCEAIWPGIAFTISPTVGEIIPEGSLEYRGSGEPEEIQPGVWGITHEFTYRPAGASRPTIRYD